MNKKVILVLVIVIILSVILILIFKNFKKSENISIADNENSSNLDYKNIILNNDTKEKN